MKRFLLVILLLCAMIIPTAAEAKVESNGQFLVTLGRTFSPFTLSENITGGIYAHATGLVSMRGNSMIFGYFGPEMSVLSTKTNLKLLGGLWMTNDGGMSALASIWLTQPLPSDLLLCVEGDVYFPVDGDKGHVQRNYYTLTTLDWMKPGNIAGFGIVQENFFSEKTFDEAAIGPSILLGAGRIWVAYDFTPEIAGDHVLYLRLVWNF